MFRVIGKLLVAALACLAPAATMAQLTPGKPAQAAPAPPPRLRGFTPTSGAQGTSVTLTFTGINFTAPASVQFSPPTGLTPSGVTVSSANQIQVTLKIDASASLGPRQVVLTMGNQLLPANLPFTVTAGQACQPNIAGVACQPAGGNQTSPPALRGYAPTQGAQGSAVTLTFTGANFAAPASVQFNPPTGLTVQSVQVSSANQLQVQLQIAASAPLGQRAVSLIVADHSLPVQPAFTVTPGQPCNGVTAAGLPCPPPSTGLTILRVTPNQVPAGSQNVDLKIEGKDFAPGAQAAFSTESGAIANVFPQGPARFVNSTEIHVVVNVLPAAIPGGRDITITNPNRANGLGKGLLDILPPVLTRKGNAPPPTIKITPIAFQKFTEGKINLTAPKWGNQWVGDIEENFGIPPLNDETVFQWSEQNPGTADYFELRIYASDGKTVVERKRIDGSTVLVSGKPVKSVPGFFRVDPAFLQLVLSSVASPKLSLIFQPWQPQPKGSSGAVMKLGYQQAPTPPASATPKLPQGDLQWEVAGYRTYNKDGTARFSAQFGARGAANSNPNLNPGANANTGSSNSTGGETDLEVEISDRWPLSAGQAPTGLDDCSKAAACGKGLQLTDVGDPSVTKNGKIVPGAISPNNYVGDPWVLSGSFDLSRSPYATNPTSTQNKCSGCLFGPVQDFQFNNLFIDWGDGHVEPLSAQPADLNNVTNWSPGLQLTLPSCVPGPQCPYSVSHTYNYPGMYNVRVFQLSDSDVQQVNPSLVASSADGPGVNPYMAAGALNLVSANKMALPSSASSAANSASSAAVSPAKMAFSSFSNQATHLALGPSAPSPATVASRAYMIYCNQVIITTVEDPLADGPLYLKGIDNPDFGSHDIKKVLVPLQPGKASSSLNTSGTAVKEAGTAVRSSVVPNPLSSSGTQSKPLAAKESGNLLAGGGSAGPAPIAICSACDDSLIGQTTLHYFGHGRARITWHVDGGTWPPQSNGDTEDIGPSAQRQNLTRQEAANSKPSDAKISDYTLYSNRLNLQMKPSADHSVWVEATVLPAPPPPNLSYTLATSINSILSTSAASSGTSAIASAAKEAQSTLNVLTPPASSNLPPLKVGFLSPSNHASPGMGAVQYVNSSLTKIIATAAVALKADGTYVSSNSSTYEITEADAKQPCKFMFPVKDGGYFEVTGLQNNATESGGKWNGTGTLLFNLASENGYEQYPGVSIKIQDWQVGTDGTVQVGSFDASPAIKLAGDTPALAGTIDRLQGTAGQTVTATLSVQLTDKTVRLPGVETAQRWPGVSSTLTSAGDWYAKGLTLPQSLLGWSAFTIQSNDVRLDLSLNDGDAPESPCGGGSGSQWLGVRLGSATIVPYTMDLVTPQTVQRTVSNWGFDGSGVCGTFNTGAFTATLEEGSVSFKSITATAQNGTFNALYQGMDVHVPWLNTDLTGDAKLQSGGGKEASITFPLSGTAQPQHYTNVTLKASNLQFTKVQDVGWAVQADSEWDLTAESKPLATVKTNMFFGMDGRAYFKEGNPTQDVKLGGSSSLGNTPLELVSAHLSASPSGTDILDFAIQTTLHLSEVMPASNVQINYNINKSSTHYSAAGPTNSSFMVEVPYPAGQPSADAKIHPTYNGGGGGGDAYSGSVDLSQLGGPPITGEFRLGYRGGHDYWLTRVTIGLGDEGVPLIPVPPVMNIYAIRGGLGHNFPISAFSDAGSLSSVQPSMDGSFLFMAGLRVGMPDQFTYMLDGNLTIQASGQNAGARMDFHAWLLTHDTSGNGQFQGYFQYAGNNFDGRIWGGLNFMNGLVTFDLGNSANNAAIDLHFGGGSWHIDAGKKEGPRIQAHFIISNANAYIMLGSDVGLSMGGDANFCLCVGDSSVASAYIKGDMDVGVQITPQPHFIGDFSASESAGVCAFDVCVSAGISAQVHVEALPLDMSASATLSLPWPLPDVTFGVHL
ncbi:MAG TPA: hypothetical protein VLY23_10660 [Candidatus Acidoferrum sp.]|nr:hypothetical protein [Candidatus Acidoferrum sp.]